jgi:hypothetical protein
VAEGIGDFFYDREGKPISLDEWGRLHEDKSYLRVGNTDLGPYWVSTVWLGVDHRFGDGPPVIFETMVFTTSARDEGRAGPEFDTRRYATEAEALAGHEEMCLLIRATMQEEPGLVTNRESTNSEEGR